MDYLAGNVQLVIAIFDSILCLIFGTSTGDLYIYVEIY